MESGERRTRNRTGRREKATPAAAMDVALDYLSRRARTIAEMRRHLAGRGYAPAEVAETIGRLETIGYLDDAGFAVRYAAWVAAEKPMGRRRIAADLARRGVAGEVIDRALGEAFGDDEEAAALAKALGRAARGPGDDRARRRLVAYLLRRGFRASHVMRAVDACLRPRADDDEGEGFEE